MTTPQKNLLNYALTILAKKRFTISEMVRKMEARNRKSPAPISDADLQEILEKLVKSNFLNDRDYAYFYIEGRTNGQYKAVGPLKLRAKLRQKGIDDIHINTALTALNPDEYVLAKSLLSRKIKNLKPSDLREQKTQAKLARFLQSNGFNTDIIYKTLRSLTNSSIEEF